MVNESFVDRWTWVHGLNGLGLGLLKVNPLVAGAVAAAYELVEWHHEKKGSAIFGTKRPESLLNIAGDTLAYGSLFFLGRASRSPTDPALGLAALACAAATTWMISPLTADRTD